MLLFEARIARLVARVETPHLVPQLVSPIMVPELELVSTRALNRHSSTSRSESESFAAPADILEGTGDAIFEFVVTELVVFMMICPCF